MKIKKRGSINKIENKKLDSDYDIAYDFAVKSYKKFREVIKSIILFGSVPKQKAVKESDIDIIVIIDDCSIEWDQELIAWYREELGKLVAEQNYRRKLHINTVTLSTFWEEVKAGEPVAINIIRYGQALIDFGGFFDPLKVMLAKGRIRPTTEAVFTSLRRAPVHISKARFSVMGSIEHLWWAMVDSAHAALMAAGEVPPSPEHVSYMLNEVFVRNKVLDKKYVRWYDEMFDISKRIIHGDLKELKGKEVDDHIEKVVEFEKAMRRITTKLLEHEKMIRIERKK